MNVYKRLHFFRDEKVVETFISLFERVFPGENLYIVISSRKSFVHVVGKDNVLLLGVKSSELKKIIEQINCFKQIVLHSIWSELDSLLESVVHPSISWIIWGADLYETLLYRKGYELYEDEDEIYRVRANYWPVPLYKLLVKIRDSLLFNKRYKTLKKITFIYAEWCDYDLFVYYYPEFAGVKHKYMYYYPIDDILSNFIINKECFGENIWVNNCSGINGNHVCIFKKLKNLYVTNKVIVPLSYGDDRYAKYILEEGRIILGSGFYELVKFLPKEEYYSLFLSSNVFLFGHFRQCAFGNILIAFYLGGKVFLFKKNPLYDYFKIMGLHVYTIDDDLEKCEFSVPLEAEKRMKNRQVIACHFSTERLLHLFETNFSCQS